MLCELCECAPAKVVCEQCSERYCVDCAEEVHWDGPKSEHTLKDLDVLAIAASAESLVEAVNSQRTAESAAVPAYSAWAQSVSKGQRSSNSSDAGSAFGKQPAEAPVNVYRNSMPLSYEPSPLAQPRMFANMASALQQAPLEDRSLYEKPKEISYSPQYGAWADVYDTLYKSFKDYKTEAGHVAILIRTECPAAARILDVGCGSGEHAWHLMHQHDLHVDGVDLCPEFVNIAKQKLGQSSEVFQADMRHLHLGRTWDALTCLFGTIAYAVTPQDLLDTMRSLASHVRDGGVLIIEPFMGPAAFVPGHTTMQSAVDAERNLKICRMTHAEGKDQGRIFAMEMQFMIASRTGIRQFTEHHDLGLFTNEEMQTAMEAAGLTTRFLPTGMGSRPVFVGRKPPAAR